MQIMDEARGFVIMHRLQTLSPSILTPVSAAHAFFDNRQACAQPVHLSYPGIVILQRCVQGQLEPTFEPNTGNNF